MQLLQRASFPSPAVNPLLIFCGCCALVHLIYSVCLTSEEALLYEAVASWFIASRSIAGGTGSYPLLLTFLCIKFQDTNSMFVPRRNFKRLNRIFKQESIKNVPSFPAQRKETKKPKKTDRKGKIPEKHKLKRDKDDRDKLKKSQHNFLRNNSTIYSADQVAPNIKHKVIIPVPTKHPSLFDSGHSGIHHPHVSRDRRGKRKSGRRGKNANEFPASTPSPFSDLGGFSLLGSAFLNHNDEEALRRKILDKVDALDPLMCLPKVLCGYSSRRRRKNYAPSRTTTPTTTTSTTIRPKTSEDVIDEYLHLLGIIPPIPKEQHEDNLKEAITYLKLKTQSSKENKKSVKSKKKKFQGTKASKQKDVVEQEQSGSASSSVESDESAEYKRYTSRRPPPSYFARHPFYKYPYHAGRPIRVPQRQKFPFNGNKESEENDLDEEDSDDVEPEDDEVDDLLDDEDVKYIVERAQMHKLMNEAGSHSEENWWQPFEEEKVEMPYYYPPPEPPYNPLAADDILSTSDGGITGWFSNMLGNFMPRISWGGGGTKKDPDDFKSDPFFTSFDGRSFTNRESRNFPSETMKHSRSSTTQPSTMARKNKQFGWEDEFSSRANSKQLDYSLGDDRVDPAAKYRTAVEIGSRVASSSQCDYIYNGCPLSYEEILAIINEPVRQKPIRRRPSTTTVSRTTTAPTATSKGNKSYAHNFITPPPPQQIVVPLHQQQQQFPYQPPQSIFLHQHHHRQRPQYHNLHPQHSYEQEQLYNQQYQQQLAQLPHVMYTSQLRRQPQPTLIPNIEDIMAQVAKSGEKPHKTKIHHALPSGEVEINVQYRPSSESSEKRRKQNLPPGNVPFSNNLNFAQDITVEETLLHPYSGPTSISSSYEHSLLSDPFNHKVLTYPNYEFSPPNGYKIRKKGEMEKSGMENKDVKVVSNTLKLVGSTSSGTNLSASEENNNKAEEHVNPSVPEKSKRKTQGIPPSLVAQKTKGKGKSKRKQMFKDTSSSAPPLRHSSNHKIQQPPQRRRQQQQGSQGMRKKWKKRNGNNKRRKKYSKEKGMRIRNDDNSSGNSGSNNSSAASTSSSNEKLQYNNKGRWGTEYLDQMQKTRRKTLQKKKRRKSHLHKQSSESIEAKKRLKIAASNAIYPIYGHPFPPPYASYYHTVVPSTPTSPSFFSYFFGR